MKMAILRFYFLFALTSFVYTLSIENNGRSRKEELQMLTHELEKLESRNKLGDTMGSANSSTNGRTTTLSTSEKIDAGHFVHVGEYINELEPVPMQRGFNNLPFFEDKSMWLGVFLGCSMSFITCSGLLCFLYTYRKKKKRKFVDLQTLGDDEEELVHRKFLNASNNYSIRSYSSDEFDSSSSEEEIFNATRTSNNTSLTSPDSSFAKRSSRRINLTSTPIKDGSNSSPILPVSPTKPARVLEKERPASPMNRSRNSNSSKTTPTKQTYSANRQNLSYGNLPLSPLVFSHKHQ